MATQVMGQSSGGGGLFTGSGTMGMALPNDMYDLPDLSRAELAAPQLIMLANVALTGEVNGGCCDYLVGEERQMGSSTGEEGDFSKGPIRCDRCGYNTNRYDHYTAHLKHHTRAGDNERVYKCIICTYTTVSEYHWRKHLRNHFPRKVYTCGKCNYFSDRKNNYVQHVRTHTGERPYKCELCPYSSSQKTHLTRHMRTHSGEKPFKCDQCSYVASNQHEVTRHARQVHNGPKPLNCPHCDYKTADRSNFKKHVELHVNPRQFNCPVCDYAASKKCNLQYHFKSKHPTCPNKTMDVSKVKLKKTKKREADLPDNKLTSEKPETEQTKGKGDVTGKKNERSVKAEKKDNVSKEKKPCSNASSQVTTRTRKSAMEGQEVDASPGNCSEKSCKSKKSKRKVEAEARPLQEPVNDEEPVTFPAGEGNEEAPLQKVEAEEAGKSLAGVAAVIKESANTSSSEENLNMPEGETSEDKHQAEAMLCEMEMDTDEKKAENFPSRDSAVEEPVSPPLPALPLEKHEAVSTTAVASPPVTVAVNESQEMDEDEGIHSHDGSDLSDNTSEDSDDSGLNGARPVPQETSGKDGKDALAVKVAEGDFVCIFCDRSFRKEKDYSKHLNRHLVNVYFLEKAAQGQE
ncbi:PREDICTED: RE1-silencing transcription factor-like [Bison bison bison]|uniref:RE1-silencing transcription factor n=1 Tax=Bison bison bison TaxID=43346 RepID=A0A6P3IUQ3_BISBB|nr:PREDICTED: RE1-silencing transcription factor-like [Bison bison bison]